MPLSIMGVWKNNKKSIVDECESHMTLFVQALSLELAAPAIIVPFGSFLGCGVHVCFLPYTVGKPALMKQMLNPEICTPVKADKKVQPKLLSNNFGTPVRSK